MPMPPPSGTCAHSPSSVVRRVFLSLFFLPHQFRHPTIAAIAIGFTDPEPGRHEKPQVREFVQFAFAPLPWISTQLLRAQRSDHSGHQKPSRIRLVAILDLPPPCALPFPCCHTQPCLLLFGSSSCESQPALRNSILLPKRHSFDKC